MNATTLHTCVPTTQLVSIHLVRMSASVFMDLMEMGVLVWVSLFADHRKVYSVIVMGQLSK